MKSFPHRSAPQTRLPDGWLNKLKSQQNQKKTRILLIGNVANYAYVTAKLLRKHGIEAVVIDPDFYHIMASPEWHEIEVLSDYGGDDYYPQWSKANRTSFKRPYWFIQGPWQTAFEALHAREFGSKWRVLKTRAINIWSRRITTKDMPAFLLTAMTSDRKHFKFARRCLSRLIGWNTHAPKGHSIRSRLSSSFNAFKDRAYKSQLYRKLRGSPPPSLKIAPNPEVNTSESTAPVTKPKPESLPNIPEALNFIQERRDYFNLSLIHI